MPPSTSRTAKMLGFLLAGIPASATAGERIVDQIVAVVNGNVITQSELEFEARVALIEHGAVAAATAKLDESTLRSALELAISQRVANAEAERLQAFTVEPGEIDAVVTRFRKRFGSDAKFQEFLEGEDVDLSFLESVLAQALRAEKYLHSKLRLRGQITDAEMKRYFDLHRSQFSGGFQESKETVRERLLRDRYEQLVRSEMSQARRNADVRIMAPFARVEETK